MTLLSVCFMYICLFLGDSTLQARFGGRVVIYTKLREAETWIQVSGTVSVLQ